MTTSNPIQIVLENLDDNEKMVNIDIIKSPVKYEILTLLRENEMNFDEIVKNTAKSKAAVSLHLKALREEGIVDYRADPSDNRKKIFFLKYKVIGSIDSRKAKSKDKTRKLIESFVKKGDIDYNLMLAHTMKSIFSEYGIEINAIFKDIGNYIGDYIFEQVYDADFDTFIENISRYWAENNLGYLRFDIKNKIYIICRDCFESVLLEKTGKPECLIETGMFEALFFNYFSFEVNVTEIKCYSMGDEMCMFEVEP